MKRHKAARFFMIITVVIVQIIFLTMIAKEKYDAGNFAAIVSLVLIILTLLFGYKYLDLHHEDYEYERFSVAIWVPIGAVMCYLLHSSTDLGSVISATMIGVLASFIPLINKESEYFSKVPIAIYCGVFVGMSSLEIAPSIYLVIAGGLVSGLFYMLSKNLFVGMGGKLGTIAFGGVVVVALINWIS
ncbi:hypothetical protein [uncultured Gelidibacter sp.]|uniref:hypothetical protein n=1 Tax=uncultured Gelidibacter sp. TaxID=259318 RepID=UPI00260C6568|nr:hypothetical protein [uncultured Gelidibacter sp.]